MIDPVSVSPINSAPKPFWPMTATNSAVGDLFSRCAKGVFSSAVSLGNYAIELVDAAARTKEYGIWGYAVTGHTLFISPDFKVDEDLQGIWRFYEGQKEPLIGYIKENLSKNESWAVKIVRLGLTDRALEDTIDQTVYALLRGIKTRLQEKGQDLTLENILLHVADSLDDTQYPFGIDGDAFLEHLIGGKENLPFSSAVHLISQFCDSHLQQLPIPEIRELLNNLYRPEGEAKGVLEQSLNGLKASLTGVYDNDLEAEESAEQIQDFIGHFLESALVKVNSKEALITLIQQLHPPLGKEGSKAVAEIVVRFLGSSSSTVASVRSLLTAVLMNLSTKFIEANQEIVKEHKTAAIVVALVNAVSSEEIVDEMQAAYQHTAAGSLLREALPGKIAGSLAKCFGIETVADIEQIVAPLLSKESAKALNDLSKEHVSKLIDSFSTEIFSILGEGAALRQRTKQLFGADTQENLEGLTPAEFAAKQIGDFTARLLPHLLQDDKKMLADSTIDSINGQFEGLLGQSLLSAEGARDPRKFLEITFQAAGEHFPKEQASNLIAQVVNNVCLRAFCKIGEEIKKLQEQEGSKEFVLGLVRNLLGTVSEHFKAVKEGRASRKDLFGHFAEKGLLDPALQEDAKHLRDHAAGSKELRDEMQKTRLEKFYQPIFGKLLVELGDITEEIIPVDPMLKGTLLSLVQDTVLPSVFQSIFDTFLDGENLSKLLIKTLRGQENSLREALAKVDDAVDAARASIQGVEAPMTAPSEELQDSLQTVVKELVEAFPNTLTTSLIQLLESDVLKKNLLGQERGMIAPLVTQVIEEALIDQDGKPKLLELLNVALSLADLREMDPDPVRAKSPEDVAEDAVLDAMTPDKLKKTLRKEVRKIVQTGLDFTWKIIADEFQKVGDRIANWLSENVHPIVATLFKGFWALLSGALFLIISPFWMIGKAIIWIISWAEAHAVMKNVDMSIHENMVLKAVGDLMEDLRKKILENRNPGASVSRIRMNL